MNITTEIQSAMKHREHVKLGVLRMLKTEMDKKTTPISDIDLTALLRKEIKKRQDSITAFEKGNRPELIAIENAEILVLKAYLPAALPDEELQSIIKDAMNETGVTTKKEMGKVMKIVSVKVAGRADGRLVNQKVMEALI